MGDSIPQQFHDLYTKKHRGCIELYHTIDATAISAAECLLKHFSRFGAPHQLRSDHGPHFIADVIHEFLARVGVKHCLTLAYSKEEIYCRRWCLRKRNTINVNRIVVSHRIR